jgi:hypothetical protein
LVKVNKKTSKKNKDEKSIDSLYRSMMMRFYGPPSRSLSFPLFKESSRNKTEYMKALQRRCEAFFSIFPNNLTFFFLFFFTFHLTLSHKKSNNQFIECSTIHHLKLLTDDFRKEKSYTLIEQKNIFLLYTSNLILKNTRHNVNYDPHW